MVGCCDRRPECIARYSGPWRGSSCTSADVVAVYRRMFAWWKLAQSWACLRHDDQRGVCPGRIAQLDVSVDFLMLRTKTTGPSKKAGTKHAFVSFEAHLVEPSLLLEGLQL